jgi:hypothetical protein
VLHGGGDRDAGGPAVGDQPAGERQEAPQQGRGLGAALVGGELDGRGEVAVEPGEDGLQLGGVPVAGQHGGRPEALLQQRFGEPVRGDGEHAGADGEWRAVDGRLPGGEQHLDPGVAGALADPRQEGLAHPRVEHRGGRGLRSGRDHGLLHAVRAGRAPTPWCSVC